MKRAYLILTYNRMTNSEFTCQQGRQHLTPIKNKNLVI